MSEIRASILVVDDDNIDRETASRYLGKEYDVILASSGDEAFTCLNHDNLACILLDLGLPDCDGREIIEALSKRAPVIVLTGQGDEAAAVEAMKRGAADYLVKDRIDQDSLARAIMGAIERRRLEHQIEDQQFRLLEDERLKVLIQLAGSSLMDLNAPITRLSVLMERFSQVAGRSAQDNELLENSFTALSEITATMRRIQYLRLEDSASGSVASQEGDPSDEAPVILCIDDDEDDRILIVDALENMPDTMAIGEVICASSIVEATALFESRPFDLIITDYKLGDGRATDILQIASRDGESVPVIVVSDSSDGEVVAELMRRGAADFLAKRNLTSELLKPALQRTLERVALSRGFRKSQERMHALAFTDELTQIYNRRFLTESMTRELNRITRHKGNAAFCLLDLDRFKRLNDEFGHAAGDYALCETARILKESIRKTDLAARYGGEEFGLFLADTDAEGATKIAESVRLNLEQEEIVFEGKRLPVTASIGLAVVSENEMRTVAELIAAADVALYKAKDGGRNCVVLETVDSSADA